MEEKKFIARNPDYKSDGCAVWVNEDKNNKPYLVIKLVGHSQIAVFKNEQKTPD